MHIYTYVYICLFDSEEDGISLRGALEAGGPLIAGCLSLQRLGIDIPVTRPAWDSNLPVAARLRLRTSERMSRTYLGMLEQHIDANSYFLCDMCKPNR